MSQEWKLVPVEPTENMVINGFESVPSECFSDEEVWEQYSEMSGCQQAAFRAKLCWAAMLASVPAPPANVDPVVIGYFYEGDVIGDQFSKLSLKHYYRRHGAAEHEYIQPVALIRQEDHRTHIIRLQAENAALQQRLNEADQRADDLNTEVRRLSQIREQDMACIREDMELHVKLQSDLASARELLKHGSSPTPAHCESVLDFLARQSAPAAKPCSHIWVSADNRGAGTGDICQACSEARPAAMDGE